MTAGVRYKWQGSTISIMTGLTGGSPLGDITGATKASPVVLTATNSLTTTGKDVIKVTEVVGMTELNNKTFIVASATGSTITLAAVDGTGYTTYSSGGKFNPATFSSFCEITNFNNQGGSAPEIPATTVCSVATEYEIGLPDYGTTELSFNFAPQSTIQQALATYAASGDVMAVKIALPNSGGTRVQLCFVQKQSVQAGNGTLWTASVTLRNTGAPVDFA